MLTCGVDDRTLGLVFELCEGGQLNKLLHTKDNQPNRHFTSAQASQPTRAVSLITPSARVTEGVPINNTLSYLPVSYLC